MGETHVRPATHVDLPGIRGVLADHGDDDGPDAPVDLIGPMLRHLLRHGRVHVAEDEGGIVGFGAVLWTGRSLHLTDLFLRKDRLGGGIGKRLLAASYPEPGGPRTTFGSDDPRAVPLYVRAGMGAWWPNLYVDGEAARLPQPPADIVCEPADAGELDRLEHAWTGVSRPADHALWAGLPESRPFVVRHGRDAVAAVHARRRRRGTGRWIERAVVAPDADPVGPLLAAFVHAGEGGPIAGCVPGPNPVLPHLLERGFSVADHDTYMASPDVVLDPARLLPHPGML